MFIVGPLIILTNTIGYLLRTPYKIIIIIIKKSYSVLAC